MQGGAGVFPVTPRLEPPDWEADSRCSQKAGGAGSCGDPVHASFWGLCRWNHLESGGNWGWGVSHTERFRPKVAFMAPKNPFRV